MRLVRLQQGEGRAVRSLKQPLELEKVTERRAKLLAAKWGAASIPLKLRPGHNTGIPDVLFLIPGGRPLFIEFKRRRPRTPKQRFWHGYLKRLGYDVQTCNDAAAAQACIRAALDAAELPKESSEVSA